MTITVEGQAYSVFAMLSIGTNDTLIVFYDRSRFEYRCVILCDEHELSLD